MDGLLSLASETGAFVGTGRALTLILATIVSFCARAACGQDSPSLGDFARQQRQQKAQSKPAPGTGAKPSKVITNEQIPNQSAGKPAVGGAASATAADPSPDGAKQSIDEIKAQFQAQKSQITSLQTRIDQVSESIRFAPPNCVANCVQWNEAQKQKQREVEQMQVQVDEARKHLQEMQDLARKHDYGSSVYDP